MKRIVLILIAIIAVNSAPAQTFNIASRLSGAPIPYSTIYFPDTRTGMYADSLGKFQYDLRGKTVTVQILAIGYKSIVSELSPATQTIYLEPSVHEIREVVVSVNGSRLQGETVMNVERLEIKNGVQQGMSLADKLTAIAGITTFTTGAGIGKPVIRGLSGNRISTFSNGIRIENQQWGDEHGLGLDENGYESVEVIKGAASLLYGSDALGGVLYFVDERYASQGAVEGRLSSGFDSNTTGLREAGSIKYSKERLHLNLFGGYTTHRDYSDGEGERVPNSRFRTGDLKATVGYTGSRFSSSLKYNYLNELYGLFDEEAAGEPNGRTPELPYQALETHIIGSNNTVFLNNGSKIGLTAGWVFNRRREFEDEEEAALDMRLSTLSYNIQWSSQALGQWNFVAGSQGMWQTNRNAGAETLIPDAASWDAAIFGLATLHWGERSTWQSGIRYDSRTIIESANHDPNKFSNTYHAFNFSTGIFQPLNDHWQMRTNIASGFRAPNIYELLSNGIHEGTNRYEIGNSNLKTENSYQIDLSLSHLSRHIEFYANPYISYIRNFIYISPDGTAIEGVPVYNYVQHDAILTGGEAGLHLHPHPWDWLHLEASYSATFGSLTAGGNLPLMPAMKISTTVTTTFSGSRFISHYAFWLQNQYCLAQKRIAPYETETPAYDLLSAGARLAFGSKGAVVLNISINNLLNTVYFDALSRYKVYGINNTGRNITAQIEINF